MILRSLKSAPGRRLQSGHSCLLAPASCSVTGSGSGYGLAPRNCRESSKKSL